MENKRIFFLFYLEVGVRDDWSGLAEIADLLETGHDLWPCNATILIDQLDGSAETVVGNAVADQHVELVLVVLDGEYHRHGLTDLDDAAHFAGPRTFAHLDLHPALQIVAQEVGRHGVQHVNSERPECHRLLVVVVPFFSFNEKKTDFKER